MTPITLLFGVKIIVTFVMVVLPFLFLPKPKLETLMAVEAKSSTLFRLYGVAILGLLFGYAAGVWQASSGEFPWGILTMGIVSNGGATFALVRTGAASKNRFLTLFFGGVTVSLVLAGVFPERAMQPLF